MRMRKKKNLEARLEAVADILHIIDLDVSQRDFKKARENKDYIDFVALFGNDNPLYLEIGCGKGKFACEYAKAHPEVNLLAVEKSQW